MFHQKHLKNYTMKYGIVYGNDVKEDTQIKVEDDGKKYFYLIGQRAWTFSKSLENKKDEYISLVYATDTNIRRFTKIKSEANPFDENWQDYFVEREERKY